MKKIGVLFLAGILLASCAINFGSTENVEIELGISNKFSTEEIQSAVAKVLDTFITFEGCTLTDLWYDEDFSNREISTYHATKDNPDNSIILLSNFDVGPSGGDGSFEPNSTYPDWMWILTRNDMTGK